MDRSSSENLSVLYSLTHSYLFRPSLTNSDSHTLSLGCNLYNLTIYLLVQNVIQNIIFLSLIWFSFVINIGVFLSVFLSFYLSVCLSVSLFPLLSSALLLLIVIYNFCIEFFFNHTFSFYHYNKVWLCLCEKK